MRLVAILLSAVALAACSSDLKPAQTVQAPDAPIRGIKTANASALPSITLAAAASSARSNAYAACKLAFYDEPPKVPDREITPLCERKGDQVFFASGYSEKDQRSIWSAYRLTARMVKRIDDSTLDRNDFGFKKNEKLDALGVSQPADSDYSNSETFMRGKKYQRGHYAPAETMSWAEAALEASFLLTNVAPQFGTMNGSIWKCFEKSIREWADEWDTMYVIVGGAITTIGKIGDAHVTVPKVYFAIVVRKDTGAALGVTVPNDGTHEYNLGKYMKPIAAVERESGVVFDLPLAAKEARPIPADWPNTCGRQRNIRDDS